MTLHHLISPMTLPGGSLYPLTDKCWQLLSVAWYDDEISLSVKTSVSRNPGLLWVFR